MTAVLFISWAVSAAAKAVDAEWSARYFATSVL